MHVKYAVKNGLHKVIRRAFNCRSIGYIPSNYVKEKELLGLQKYE